MMVLIGLCEKLISAMSFDSFNMSSSQGRKKWRLPYVISMCELVECFATRQKITFFALVDHIVYVIVAKSE
jgi:hypothetical protein